MNKITIEIESQTAEQRSSFDSRELAKATISVPESLSDDAAATIAARVVGFLHVELAEAAKVSERKLGIDLLRQIVNSNEAAKADDATDVPPPPSPVAELKHWDDPLPSPPTATAPDDWPPIHDPSLAPDVDADAAVPADA